MGLCSVLVLLDDHASSAGRLRAAKRLAREQRCHLVGLAVTGMPERRMRTGPADMTGLARDVLRDQAEAVAQRFRDECHAEGVPSFEAVVEEADALSSLVRHAHCSDLTVVSQVAAVAADRDLLEHVILRGARPTLVIPRAGWPGRIGQTALVAWDDSREASRALADAQPLLARADRVELVAWPEKGLPDVAALGARLETVRRWLLRRGITTHARVSPRVDDVADALRAHALHIRADLVVMGAYGRSRWSEHVLGGTTRDMLAASEVPLLVSH